MIDLVELIVAESVGVREALGKLDEHGGGFLFVVNGDSCLTGVLTDGDIRRGLLADATLDSSVDTVMQRQFKSFPVDTPEPEIRHAISERISFIPLVDEAGRPVDYASLSRTHRFPVAEPVLKGRESEYVQECIQTGWISSQGRFVNEFENQFSKLHGDREAVAVSNGTVAIHLALMALGVGEGDEVIVPNFTFAASASAIVHAGATPVFVDVDPESWLLDLDQVRAAITKKTRAVLAVHLYGLPCAMHELNEIAEEHGLFVIEDAAEALGSRIAGKPVGVFGDVATFSFFGNKTLTTGEGGMVVFRDAEVARKARVLRDHGMNPDRRYWHDVIGYNYRLTNLQAAVGVAQCECIDSILKGKRELEEGYLEVLGNVPGLTFPKIGKEGAPVCWFFTCLLDDELNISRDDLAERLKRNGIDSRPVFQPLHQMGAFEKYAGGKSFPVTENLARRGLSLPSSTALSREEVRHIARTVKRILNVREMQESSQDE
ncbi:MAG: aminotransferase class I/II-fold pyridoxal phosphate-dependent enzyme [Verrucomicrobiota bacterium]